MAFKMTIKKRLPSRRLSVSLPGELYAKLELYLRDFAGGAASNDVIAEALRLCFDADKEFGRAWEREAAAATRDQGAAAARGRNVPSTGTTHDVSR